MQIITLSAKAENTKAVLQFIEENLQIAKVSRKVIMKMLVAADEIYSNIVSYSEANETAVQFEILNNMISISFIDDGMRYNPLEKEDPDISLKLDESKIGGRGIFIVKKTMDHVKYVYKNGKNILTVMKKAEI